MNKNQWVPRDEDYKSRIERLFAAQNMMATLGMSLDHVTPGHVEITMSFNTSLSQHHGFHHAGVATTGMDTACGFAACSLMDASEEVLTVEFKSSFLAPATTPEFRFVGEVLKAGRSLYFCQGQAFGIDGGTSTLIASMSATMMAKRA